MIRTSRTLLIGLILTASAYPQSPPPGDPEVFLAYLRRAHQEAFDAGQGLSTAQASAARVGAQADDLPTLEAVYQNTAALLELLDSETRSYVGATIQKGQKPQRAKLDEIYARRIQVLERAKDSLRAGLVADRWLRIEKYLEGEFRTKITRRPLPSPNVQ